MSKWDHASVVWYARTLVLDCGTICMLQEEIRRTDFVSAPLSLTCLLSNLGEDDPEEGRLDRIFQRESSKVRSTREKILSACIERAKVDGGQRFGHQNKKLPGQLQGSAVQRMPTGSSH